MKTKIRTLLEWEGHIEDYVEENLVSYSEAVISICEEFDIDLCDSISIVSENIKAKIRLEYEETGILKPVPRFEDL